MTLPNAARRPRVVLLTQPTLCGALIINRLAEEEGLDLVGIGLSVLIVKNQAALPGIATLLRRSGWRYLLAGAIESNVSWAWLRLTRRPAGLRKIARQRVRTMEDVNSPSTLEWLRRMNPDYVVSFYFNQWIGSEVRGIPRRGCINVHPSLLPALRGPDPVFRALERGLRTAGVTIHEVAGKIDAGRILHQAARDIPPHVTRFGLLLSLIRDGADVVARWMAGGVSQQASATSDTTAGDYSTFPSPTEVASFLSAGHRLMRVSEWRKALSEVR
jgi:methionyl-tRNA formyltransferase